MKCECGFKFAGPGEFRNCNAYIAENGKSCVICPECGRHYSGEYLIYEPGDEECQTN